MNTPVRIVLTGVETTGKTTLSRELASHFGAAVLAEYGRNWAEAHGTDFTMAAKCGARGASGFGAWARSDEAASMPKPAPAVARKSRREG